MSRSNFIGQFAYNHPNIVTRKNTRFRDFLLAAAAGKLFVRPDTVPLWTLHIRWHKPVYHVLTSSYDDVEATLNSLRQANLGRIFLFVGGDGQTMMRINHLLANHPDLYIDQTPVVIPVQGESPHGVHHFLHAGFRLFKPIIRVAAGLIKDKSVSEDPHSVKEFNRALFLLYKITRGFSEYLLTLRDAPSLDFPEDYIRQAQPNIDLLWIVHFLYDCAFLVLDLKKCIRSNDSKGIDLLYREFLTSALTGTANKTQYTQMSILRVFWAHAMHPDLQHIYHGIRSLPVSRRPGSRVGWDMLCEWLHRSISAGVQTRVSEERITHYIENFAFMEHCHEICEDWAYQGRADYEKHIKDIAPDAQLLVGELRQKVGSTWQQATRPNLVSALGIDHRGPLPWDEMRRTMLRTGPDALPVIINRHLEKCVSSVYSFGA